MTSEPAEVESGQSAEDTWWVAFGASVRAARKSRGLRQEDLAHLLGLTRVSVANIESGRQRTNAYTAARMVAELGMTVPGWQVEPATTLLAQQLTKTRQALADLLCQLHHAQDHLTSAQASARDGLA